MSESIMETSIKIITFSGKKSDWPIWEERFLARAKRKGYKDILTGKPEDIPKVGDSMNDAKKKVKNLNELAYADLILSMDAKKATGRIAFGIVKNSKDEKQYPDGNASKAWAGLMRKYAPNTAPSLMKHHKLFYGAKLKKGVDPEVYITYLEDLRKKLNHMGHIINDQDFFVHILNSLTSEYRTDVKFLEKRLTDTKFTLTDIREDLSLTFERNRLYSQEEDEENDDNDPQEEALIASGSQFKGRCNNCGKYGHKSANCWNKDGKKNTKKKEQESQRPKNENSTFTGTCHYCKKKGHKAFECRKKQRDMADQANTA